MMPPAERLVPVLSVWTLLFFAIAIASSFLLLPVFILLGLSQGQDPVFALNAAIGGLLARWVLRQRFGVTIIVSRDPRLDFILLWWALLILVAVLGMRGANQLAESLSPS
jgi:hypothetical protein